MRYATSQRELVQPRLAPQPVLLLHSGARFRDEHLGNGLQTAAWEARQRSHGQLQIPCCTELASKGTKPLGLSRALHQGTWRGHRHSTADRNSITGSQLWRMLHADHAQTVTLK